MLTLENNEHFKAQIIKKAQDRILGVYIEAIILSKLRREPLSGYDLIKLFQKDFHVLVSSGTMYSTLYSLERQGLIKGSTSGRKKVFELTHLGKVAFQIISESDDLSNLLLMIAKEFFAVPHTQAQIRGYE